LLLRGRCNLRMGLGQQALTDADDALELTDRDAHVRPSYNYCVDGILASVAGILPNNTIFMSYQIIAVTCAIHRF